jgi:hypothetical protein
MANHPAPLHADVVSFLPGRQDEDDALDLLGHLNELREQRISALEEVMAAPWPHRWLLSLGLRRQLRRSVDSYGWAGRSWHDRRAAWMTDKWLDRDRGPGSCA